MLSDQKLVRTKKELSQQYVVCLSSVGGNNTSTKLDARHSFNKSSFAYEYLLFPAKIFVLYVSYACEIFRVSASYSK